MKANVGCEYVLELNPSANDAHIEIRTKEKAQALEYTKRIFPKSYLKEEGNVTFIHFNEAEEDNNKAQGMITERPLPMQWVTNRRVDETRKAA